MQEQTLVGIARLAAASPSLRRKRVVEYYQLPAESILNRCSSERMPFRWTINPYRGCEFGCKYCYARYTHEFMGLQDPLEFEEKIYSKRDAGALLRRELTANPDGEIAIGTATDPYQPAERVYQTTRSILEVLSEFRGLRISITTKSDLITRDSELLREIGRENSVRVHLTITTLNAELARVMEPRAPRPELRLRALAALARAGIRTMVNAMPVLPGITDGPGELEALAAQAARNGATQFATSVLFLKPSAKAAFLPFLEERFPSLLPRYTALYARSAYLRGAYEQSLTRRVDRIRRLHGWAIEPAETNLPAFGLRRQIQLFPGPPVVQPRGNDPA
jgi:DNA repair photolyase